MLAIRPTRFAHVYVPLLALAAALVTPPARAWGDEGHRVVGELAFRYLSSEAQARVQEALTDPGYETLAEAATWPDTFARRHAEYDPMKSFHYVNVDAKASRYQRQRDCPHGCIVSALGQLVTLLESRDPPLSLAERRRSIYWIAHFFGDIHQPLHIAHPDGKGGGATRLAFFDSKEKPNAHWIWDIGLFERRQPESAPDSASAGPSYVRLAEQLARSLEATQRRAYQRTTSPELIANESLLIAQRYAFLRGEDHVDEAYAKTRWPIVAQQLQKAGVRLAAVLENALGKRPLN